MTRIIEAALLAVCVCYLAVWLDAVALCGTLDTLALSRITRLHPASKLKHNALMP